MTFRTVLSTTLIGLLTVSMCALGVMVKKDEKERDNRRIK